MKNVMDNTKKQSGSIFREVRNLDHNGQRKGFLGAHENNALAFSPFYFKNLNQQIRKT